MEKRNSPDRLLLGFILALVVLGILILGSVSSSFSLQKTGSTSYYLSHQLLLGLLPGILLALIAYLIPLERIKKWSFIILIVSALLLITVFLPVIGGQIKGAYRWVSIGSVSFQPSEFLKIAFIVYAAAWLSKRKDKKQRGAYVFIPFLVVLGTIALLLLLQRDVSTLGIITVVGMLMYFLARMPLWHLLLMFLFGCSGFLAMIRFAPYRLSRLLVFLHPDLDPLGQGYHIKQALIGIGSGGLTGIGLGMSFQKFGVLPEPISDSIFAVFAEEMGFFGASLLLLLFVLFAWRGFHVAMRAQDQFSKLVAIGITSWITLQAFVNIGSMLGLLPLAGIPLPFISYGGSALVAELIGVGLLLNISKQTS